MLPGNLNPIADQYGIVLVEPVAEWIVGFAVDKVPDIDLIASVSFTVPLLLMLHGLSLRAAGAATPQCAAASLVLTWLLLENPAVTALYDAVFWSSLSEHSINSILRMAQTGLCRLATRMELLERVAKMTEKLACGVRRNERPISVGDSRARFHFQPVAARR